MGPVAVLVAQLSAPFLLVLCILEVSLEPAVFTGLCSLWPVTEQVQMKSKSQVHFPCEPAHTSSYRVTVSQGQVWLASSQRWLFGHVDKQGGGDGSGNICETTQNAGVQRAVCSVLEGCPLKQRCAMRNISYPRN